MRLQLMKVSCKLKTELPVRLLLKLRSVKKRGSQGQSFLFFSSWPQDLEIIMKKGSKSSSKG